MTKAKFLKKPLARQRWRMADYFGKGWANYRATFGYISHKKSGRACILLLDPYPVTRKGNKIALRSKYDFSAPDGRHVLADHVWINLTLPWLRCRTEFLCGDTVEFQAKVARYKILRKDTQEKRNRIFEEGQQKISRIWWNFKNISQLSYDPRYTYHVHKVQSKIREVQKQIKQKQNQVLLVDYTFNYVKGVKMVNPLPVHYGMQRLSYDPSRIKDVRYTKFLAWHSHAYADKKMKNKI